MRIKRFAWAVIVGALLLALPYGVHETRAAGACYLSEHGDVVCPEDPDHPGGRPGSGDPGRPGWIHDPEPSEPIPGIESCQGQNPLDVFREHARAREGYSLKVYLDELGNPTVGIGHRVTPGDGLDVGDEITPARVEEFWLRDSLAAFTAAMAQAKEAGICDPCFIAALASVNLQLGTGWRAKLPAVWALIAAGRYDEAADRLDGTLWMELTPVRVRDFQMALRALPPKPPACNITPRPITIPRLCDIVPEMCEPICYGDLCHCKMEPIPGSAVSTESAAASTTAPSSAFVPVPAASAAPAAATTAKCYDPTPACEKDVTPANFKSMLDDNGCGCTLKMASGSYPFFNYTKKCTTANPFILEAQAMGGPSFPGFNVNGDGLIVNGTNVSDQITINGDYNRITRTLFVGNGQVDFIEGSAFNRIDHSDFLLPPHASGETNTAIAFYRPRSVAQMYDNNRIDTNFFTTNSTALTGGHGYAIFLCMYGAQNGYPFLSQFGSAKTLIENNLFKNWNRTVMEVKCSDNVFRNNTMMTTGRVLNRHGGRNIYENNIFDHMQRGLTVREFDNQIINNYFNDAAIMLYKGSRRYPDGACSQPRAWMPAGYPGAPQGPPAVRTIVDKNRGPLIIGIQDGSGCEVPALDTQIRCHEGPWEERPGGAVGTTGPTATAPCGFTMPHRLTEEEVGRDAPEGSCEVPIISGGTCTCTNPVLPPPGPCGKNSGLPWASGFSPGTGIGSIALGNARGFGDWRKRAVDVGTVFIGKNSWQTSYAAYLTNEVLRPTGAVRAFSQAGICPVLTVPLVTQADFMKFDMVAGGGIDAEHTAIAKKIHEAIGDGTIYLRLGHEADEGYPWSYTNPGHTADPATYRAAWGRIAKIYKAEMPNARIVWNVLKNTRMKIRDYYPGSDVVDVLSIDPYDNGAGGFCDGPTSPGWVNMCYGRYNPATGESKGIKGLLDFAKTVGKRIAVDEWGASNKELSGDNGANNSYYAGAMYDFFNANRDYIEYESYYNRAGGGKHQIWPRVDYNGKVSDAYWEKYHGAAPAVSLPAAPACPATASGGG